MSSSSETKPVNYGAVATDEKEADAEALGGDNTTPPIKKKSCNDVLFALLFIAHLVYLVYRRIQYNSDDFMPVGEIESNATISSAASTATTNNMFGAMTETQADLQTDLTEKFSDKGVLKFVGVVTAVSLGLSTLAIIFMTTFSDELIGIALAAPVIGSLIVGGFGYYFWNKWVMIGAAIAFLLFLVIAIMMRKKIDFAAANLRVALTVIRTNYGLIVVSYLLEIVAFGWSLLWFDATGAAMSERSWPIVFVYLLSFFWTHQVINNLQHVIVASVLGTWWYKPEDANSCWDDGLNQAICHSLTYSFGSICFGSLLASIVQTLKWFQRLVSRHQNRCAQCIAGMVNCCLGCLQGIIEYFNKWTYVMVGIHGESYLKGGKEIIRLFKVRNWEGIIEDGLADLVMFFMKLAVAFCTGLMGWWLVSKGDDDIFVGIGIDPEDDNFVGFISGLLVGYVVASIMMELVSSAVNAVIVCFAKAPKPFQQNYPELCKELLAGWEKAYPIECEDEVQALNV